MARFVPGLDLMVVKERWWPRADQLAQAEARPPGIQEAGAGSRFLSSSAAAPGAFCTDYLSRLTSAGFGPLHLSVKAGAACRRCPAASADTNPQQVHDQAAFRLMPESLSEDRL